MKPYKKQIKYYFEIQEEGIHAYWYKDTICVEEVRKNGQEDTHCEGQLFFEDDVWVWYEEPYNFNRYFGEEFSEEIRNYINNNKLPKE